MERTRSFLSLNIDTPLIVSLTEIQERMRDALNDYSVKWEKPDKFHLTIRFLGDLYDNTINELTKQMEFIYFGFKSIEMYTSGIGFFPDKKYPNVVFIDLVETANNSEVLVTAIDSILNRLGIKPDKKFVPHITIGRFRRENRIRMKENINIGVEKIHIKFDSFYLMKSQLTPRGSVYSAIKQFPFDKEES